MTAAIKIVPDKAPKSEPLKKKDRCDGCRSARAYVRATKGELELLFCLHHYRKFEPNLLTGGWSIDNQQHILEEEVRKYNTPSDDNF